MSGCIEESDEAKPNQHLRSLRNTWEEYVGSNNYAPRDTANLYLDPAPSTIATRMKVSKQGIGTTENAKGVTSLAHLSNVNTFTVSMCSMRKLSILVFEAYFQR